jgi:hypothetical protein
MANADHVIGFLVLTTVATAETTRAGARCTFSAVGVARSNRVTGHGSG